MLKFMFGLATGYLTMTKNGKQIMDSFTNSIKNDATNYLKREGIIENEQSKPTGHAEPLEPDDKPQEQYGTDESVNE